VDQPLTNRRADPRFKWPHAVVTRATLRPGCDVRVIDLSAGGALVQAAKPLRPGAKVHFQLATADRVWALAGRVLRCAVWLVDPHAGVTYRGALQFEERCESLWEQQTRGGSEVPAVPKPGEDNAGNGVPATGARSGPVHRKPVK
jgi:hypothetical protein